MTIYVVQPGDSFFDIAAKLGVSREAFRAANAQVPDINLITPGQVLNVPEVAPPSVLPAATTPGQASIVAPGRNLWVWGGVFLAGVALARYLWPRRNPSRSRKPRRRTSRAITPRDVVTAYQIGTALVRRS